MKETRLDARFVRTSIKLFSAVVIGLTLASVAWLAKPGHVQAQLAGTGLTVQVEASQGFAAPANAQPANFLVVVTDSSGAAVTNLTQADFAIVNHFSLPGQTCGFSNNIVSFNNVLNGAYHIQVAPALPACNWVEGDYLAQVLVSNGVARGQAAATLSIKCPVRCARTPVIR